MSVIEELLTRPDAPIVLQKVNKLLEDEQAKRSEFLKNISPNEKAEFILGEVIFHSPVKSMHNQITLRVAALLNAFVLKNKLGQVGVEKLLISLSRNDYEPDACFFQQEKSQHFDTHQMRFPAPDLVVEVLSESTKERDRGIKFQDYEAHGVTEYWLISPEEEIVEQYIMEKGKYLLNLKAKEGNLVSVAVKGFDVNIASFFEDQEHLGVMQSIFGT